MKTTNQSDSKKIPFIESFEENFYPLDEETIITLNKQINSADFNNVVIGRLNQCFGVCLIEDDEPLIYDLFYIAGENQLNGFMLRMNSELKSRDDILLFFSNFLSLQYETLNVIDTFNTFQEQVMSIHEKQGFITISSLELDKYDDPNPTVIAPGYRGVLSFLKINKLDFYREVFNNKNLQDEDDESFVYLMLNTRTSRIKIGRSKHPSRREKTLQSEEPEVDLISIWKAPKEIETELHSTFCKKRVRGEWFNLSIEDLIRIQQRMDEFD